MNVSYSPSARFFYKLRTQSFLHVSFQSLLFMSHVFWIHGLWDILFFVVNSNSICFLLFREWIKICGLLLQLLFLSTLWPFSLHSHICFLSLNRICNGLKGKPTWFRLNLLINFSVVCLRYSSSKEQGHRFSDFFKVESHSFIHSSIFTECLLCNWHLPGKEHGS